MISELFCFENRVIFIDKIGMTTRNISVVENGAIGSLGTAVEENGVLG